MASPTPAKSSGPKVGLIILFVVLGLGACGALVSLGERAQTNRELDEALRSAEADAGVDLSDRDFEATRTEERCLEDSGIEMDDVIRALTDTSVAGGAAQLQIMDALLVCAPRIVDEPEWLEDNAAVFSATIGSEITTEETRCYYQYAIDNSDQPATALSGEDPFFVYDAITACFSDETQAALFGEAGAGAQAYGDNAALDLLYDECDAGSDYACDLLYEVASFESDYEILSRDCAGRGLADGDFCTSGMRDSDLDAFADADSPGWDAALEDCRAGDMLACDFTYSYAPILSDLERVGETCGERAAVLPTTCRDRFGLVADE